MQRYVTIVLGGSKSVGGSPSGDQISPFVKIEKWVPLFFSEKVWESQIKIICRLGRILEENFGVIFEKNIRNICRKFIKKINISEIQRNWKLRKNFRKY